MTRTQTLPFRSIIYTSHIESISQHKQYSPPSTLGVLKHGSTEKIAGRDKK